MANFSMDTRNGTFSEQAAWASLKQAIAESSGFKSWSQERKQELLMQEMNLDKLVHAYLRETLATLAY